MGSQLLQIQDSEGNVLGHIDLGEFEIPIWDFALTPIVSADLTDKRLDETVDQREPRVTAFLASPRTTLDTRPRMAEPPYEHVCRTIVPGDTVAKTKKFEAWLEAHGVTVRDCYKVELGDTYMVVYCYKRNAEGSKFIEGKEAATEPPRTVELKSPAPEPCPEDEIEFTPCEFNGEPGVKAKRGPVEAISTTRELAESMLIQIEQGKLREGRGLGTMPEDLRVPFLQAYGNQVKEELIGRWTYDQERDVLVLRRPEEDMKLTLQMSRVRADATAARAGQDVGNCPDWEPREN